MTRIKNNQRKNFRYYLGIGWGITFICYLLFGIFYPIFATVVVNTLPYLHSFDTKIRLMCTALILLFFALSYVIIADKKQKASVAPFMAKGVKERFGSILGLLLFTFCGAELSGTSLGTLVKIFPNKPYFVEMEVVNAKARGSKMRSVDLDLKSNTDGKVYYLTLSKSLFDYPKFKVGDKLIFKGKQNWFGVYIEEFR